jgi:hypothetical protein
MKIDSVIENTNRSDLAFGFKTGFSSASFNSSGAMAIVAGTTKFSWLYPCEYLSFDWYTRVPNVFFTFCHASL